VNSASNCHFKGDARRAVSEAHMMNHATVLSKRDRPGTAAPKLRGRRIK